MDVGSEETIYSRVKMEVALQHQEHRDNLIKF